MMMQSRCSAYWFFLVFFQVLLISTMVQGSTWFETPSKYTQWRAGEMIMIRLVSDTRVPIGGEIQLIDQNGFFPRDLGIIGLVNHTSSVIETVNSTTGMVMTSTYSFKLWDQLPEGYRYQLAFFPFSSAHGSNAFSYYFTVAKHG